MFKAERLFLSLPLLILPFVAWEFATGPALPLYVAPLAVNLLEGIFASTGHTGLTWALIFMTPEGKEWWGDRESLSLRWKIAAVTFGSFFVSFAVFMIDRTRLTDYFFALYSIASIQHGISQVQGLSFAYSFKDNPCPLVRPRIERLHRMQKRLFFALLIIACAYPVDAILRWDLLTSPAAKWTLFALGCALALALMLSNLALPSGRKNKMYFLARLMNVPFGVFSMFAQLSIRLFHGIEYLFVYDKMISNSGYRKLHSRRQMYTASIGLYLLVTMFWLFTFFGNEGVTYLFDYHRRPWWFCAIGALAVTRALSHFYLDRVIFRMSHPVSKRCFAQILLSEPELASVRRPVVGGVLEPKPVPA